jgi:hypothetical protein
MINVTFLAYSILAPLSVVSESLILYSFIRLSQIKEHPEIIIFWETLAQLILDIHWFTGIAPIKDFLGEKPCQFFGSFSMYFYFLSWDYNLLLSIEILLKILQPHKTGYSIRRIWYHCISHLTSFIVFLFCMLGDNNGNSIMKTCFVQEKSVYELFVLVPALLHFPLCIIIIGYTIYISYGTFYLRYLNYHMLVVATFAFSWVPIAIVHGLNYYKFEYTVPEAFVVVIGIQIAVVLGAPSGLFVFLARMKQKNLLKKLLTSIFRPKKFTVINKQDSLTTQLFANDVSPAIDIFIYSTLFECVTTRVCSIQAVIDILVSLSNVYKNSHANQDNLLNKQDHREWNFSIEGDSSDKFCITEYNYKKYKQIMDKCGITYLNIAE